LSLSSFPKDMSKVLGVKGPANGTIYNEFLGNNSLNLSNL